MTFVYNRGSRGCDRMVVGFTTTFIAICNQCLSPLMLWVLIPLMVRCTRYNIMWYSLSVTCGRSMVFSGYSSFTNKTDYHVITEILLKVALNTITLTRLFIILVEEGRTSVHDIYLTFCRKKIWLTSSQWITYFFSISDPSFLFISNLSFAKSIAIAKTTDDFSLYHLLQKPEIADNSLRLR